MRLIPCVCMPSPIPRQVRGNGVAHLLPQSITELEILEAEADDRPSINKLSKRKRDGV